MTTERRPCACRGFLEADPCDPVDVEQAVKAHQREPDHLAWRTREQLAGNLVAPQKVAIAGPLPSRGAPRTSIELRRVA